MSFLVTDYGRTGLVQSFVGITTAPSSFYMALLLALPDETVNGTTLTQVEVPSGVGYSRQAIPTGGANWAESGLGVVNTSVVTFGPATAEWGLVRAWALCSNATAGEVFLAGDLPLSVRVTAGLELEVGEGALAIEAESPRETVVT